MKTTNVQFGNFAKDAMTLSEMNFLRGGICPETPGDLTIPPEEEGDDLP